MFDENQIVQVRWNNSNREWYESKGYVFTKRNSFFNVKAKDLSPRSSARVKAICDYCGENYDAYFVILMDGRKVIKKDCCCNCTGKKANEVTKQRRAEKNIGLATKVCEERGYILLTTVDDYTDAKMNVDFICPKHGKQTVILDNLIHGHGCRRCANEYVRDMLKHDAQYVKEYIESINGNKLLNPEDYKGTFERNLNILCSCGNIFTTSFSNYSRYGVDTCCSCSCKESVGERRVRNFLESNDIEFVQEKRFTDCRDNKPLPFDFYLPNHNLIIEFDGRHHFEEKGRGNHEITVKHDEIKNKYCKDNNINLLRIPYWDGNNIEDIISKQLNL